jgi:hypothetical protein
VWQQDQNAENAGKPADLIHVFLAGFVKEVMFSLQPSGRRFSLYYDDILGYYYWIRASAVYIPKGQNPNRGSFLIHFNHRASSVVEYC